MKQTERNFWLNISLFVTFLSTVFTGLLLWLVIPKSNPSVFAGIDRVVWLAFHAGSGLSGLLGVIIHIVWHWSWLKALRGRSLKTLKRSVRANRVVDRITWIAFIATNLFGALDRIIPGVENSVSISSRLHVAFGMAWLLGITVHLALHSKWITSAARRHLTRRRSVACSKQGAS